MTLNLGCIVRESAKSYPDKKAVIHDGGSLTYRELDELSDRLAAGLRAKGFETGDRIAVQLPNLPQFVIAYFGILKAGCVVVPMNVLLKATEVAFQLGDCQASALIAWAGVGEGAAKAVAAAGVEQLYVVNTPGTPEVDLGERFETLFDVDPSLPPTLVQTDPGDTAVVIYTSGTTGLPKGAELSHFQLLMNSDTPGAAVRDPRGRRGPRRAAPVPRLRPLQRAEHLRPLRCHDVAGAALRRRQGHRGGAARPGHGVRGRADDVHRPAGPSGSDQGGRRLVACGHLRRRLAAGRGPRRLRAQVRPGDPRGLRPHRERLDHHVQRQRDRAQDLQRRQADLGCRPADLGQARRGPATRPRARRRGGDPGRERDEGLLQRPRGHRGGVQPRVAAPGTSGTSTRTASCSSSTA